MTLRNTSGKFSLPTFGRRNTSGDGPSSPSATRTNGNGYYDDDGYSPGKERDRDRDGTGAGGLDALGKKLAKGIAHQSLLPGLGNRDLRALQDVISSEKSVLQATEKLASESQKAAAALPPYGSLEGPDLQDVLTHSSTLLTQLTNALHVFTEHQSNMRGCYKRIREREEALDELRRRRRATGAKSETAEKKLAKMGPENKALPQQTELLERLRTEMRQMDTEILTEESKIGDFKRQIMKEALSIKFGGLEELGEKMCIIGELGKLLLEEIPLEETPPGYGRARYTGYDKTENAVNEATKCLATVQFSAGDSAPRPPGLPHPLPEERFTAPPVPLPKVRAAEEFANYPGNAASPPTKGKQRDYSLDNTNPYGEAMSNPYGGDEHAYGDYGGTKGNGDHVVWQGPPDDMIHGNEQDAHDAIGSAMADEGGGTTPEVGAGRPQDYEYEQQRQLDAERVETQQAEAAFTGDTLHPPHDQDVVSSVSTPYEEPGNLNSPWEPLNVKRDHAADPESMTLRDANLGPPISVATTDTDHTAQPAGHTPHTVTSPTSIDLPPPPTSFRNGMPSVSTPGDGDGGFYTPLEGPTLEQAPVAFPESRPIPAGVPVGGRISAAAFRRAKPRTSLDHDEAGSPLSPMLRRLPVPPLRPETPVDAGVALAASPSIASEDYGYRFGHGHVWKVEQDAQSFADAKEEASPPPVNGGDSLR